MGVEYAAASGGEGIKDVSNILTGFYSGYIHNGLASPYHTGCCRGRTHTYTM